MARPGDMTNSREAQELAEGLRQGFDVASTDDGHSWTTAAWALGHPEKVVDFGYRAVHLTRRKIDRSKP
jgi:feruloyl esterase